MGSEVLEVIVCVFLWKGGSGLGRYGFWFEGQRLECGFNGEQVGDEEDLGCF